MWSSRDRQWTTTAARAVVTVVLAVWIGSGCGVQFIGTPQIQDHCSYQVNHIDYCYGGEHDYYLSGICFAGGQILPFQAALRYDERDAVAKEQIRVLHQGTFKDGSLIALCDRDPFLDLQPSPACETQDMVSEWLHLIDQEFQQPIARGLISPLHLGMANFLPDGCAVPPEPPPAQTVGFATTTGGTPPLLPFPQGLPALTSLVITAPTEGQVFAAGTADFQLAVVAFGTAPVDVDIEWQTYEDGEWRDAAAQTGPFGQLPLTVEVAAAPGDGGLPVRVQVRDADSKGHKSGYRTFQLVDGKLGL